MIKMSPSVGSRVLVGTETLYLATLSMATDFKHTVTGVKQVNCTRRCAAL